VEEIVDQVVENTDTSDSSKFLEGLRTGSPEAFESFYKSYFPRIHSFIRRRIRNTAEAEDLSQEIFLAVMGSIDSYQARADFDSWVFGVARNLVREHLRRTQRRYAREALAQSRGAPPTPEEKLFGRRVVETVGRRLASVESWQAEAFALQCFQRVPRAEIARRTGRTRYALRTSIERLRRGVAIDLGISREGQ
jgi:RNA polymerase sigma-70 factor (ECF subfamily)